MPTETLRVRLVGTAPLLMRSSRLVDPLDEFTIALDRLTRKRLKTRTDHMQIAKTEWTGSMWTLDGKPCVPGTAVEACIVQAAKARRSGAAAKSGIAVRKVSAITHSGPADLDALWEDQRFRLRVPVRIRGVRLMRTRPRFPEWSVEVELLFLPSLVSRQDLLDDLVVAGDVIGVGDWRPRYGRFSVQVL